MSTASSAIKFCGASANLTRDRSLTGMRRSINFGRALADEAGISYRRHQITGRRDPLGRQGVAL